MMKWLVSVSGKLAAKQEHWKRQGAALRVYSGLSKSSQQREPLSITDSGTDAWGWEGQCQTMHRGCAPARETRLFSSLISFPISSSHLLSHFPAGSGHPPIQLFLHGKGLPLLLPCLLCSLKGPCSLPLAVHVPAVGMRRACSGEWSRAKPGLWAVSLLHIEWGAITAHNDLFFLQDKYFCDKKWESPDFTGGASNWHMMSDKIIEWWKGLCWKEP